MSHLRSIFLSHDHKKMFSKFSMQRFQILLYIYFLKPSGFYFCIWYKIWVIFFYAKYHLFKYQLYIIDLECKFLHITQFLHLLGSNSKLSMCPINTFVYTWVVFNYEYFMNLDVCKSLPQPQHLSDLSKLFYVWPIVPLS